MKTLVALASVTIALFVGQGEAGTPNPCPPQGAKGFASIRPEPNYLVGTIPSHFTDRAVYFSRRFNCRGLSAQVRRVSLGFYEVKFPGLDSASAILVSATSAEGVSTSAEPAGSGVVRVALRGPLNGSDVASRRDVAFTVVVF